MSVHFLHAKPKKPAKSDSVLSPKGLPGARAKPNIVKNLRVRLQLSQPAFARLLPVSVRTLATLESGAPSTEVVTRRLNEIRRLTNALSEVVKVASLGTWLQEPNPAFDGLKPLEVIERGESDCIWSMIYFLRSGVPS
jgi:DNA-binding transcriptional regulator YiaG